MSLVGLSEVEQLRDANLRMAAGIEEMAARIERLEAALRPFANCADANPEAPGERMLMYASAGGGTFLGFSVVDDLRRARAALAGKEG